MGLDGLSSEMTREALGKSVMPLSVPKHDGWGCLLAFHTQVCTYAPHTHSLTLTHTETKESQKTFHRPLELVVGVEPEYDTGKSDTSQDRVERGGPT